MSSWPNPVLLYDGECGLCNRLIRLLMRLDGPGRLRYSALQRAPARAFLDRHGEPTEALSTVYFVPDWGRPERTDYLTRSDAVAAALKVCGGGARVLGRAFEAVPKPVRDRTYSGIGHLRYRIFGPWRDRPLPRPEWNRRIIL